MAIERKPTMGGGEHFAEGEKLLLAAEVGGVGMSATDALAMATMAQAHFTAAVGCVLTDLVKALRT